MFFCDASGWDCRGGLAEGLFCCLARDTPVADNGDNGDGGYRPYKTADVFMAITPVSITEKAELVSKVCLKPRRKIPGRIDFMTREQLRAEVKTWLGC